ncbi:MAG: alpha-ketoglutarate-dependent dioxygenase AlkB [Saprospiraceae bacterium]|nr:alpha-ketoglutarate-dependent dioxygenase AlkB [Saprospiraceae bacterium]
MPIALVPFLTWVQDTIDPNINGVLINWYDGNLNHYIGKHRDSVTGLKESPIVTMSFGQERIFRLRSYQLANNFILDIPVKHGSCIILPFMTNRHYTHEITKQKVQGNRISLTFRAFEN